jgi:hypothetical protein
MAYYTNPYFNQKYVPETYTYDELDKKIALSGWDILKNPTDEMIPYLCQLLKVADIADVDPAVIIQNEENFDFNKYLDTFYKQLSSMDEGRVNFYEVWQELSTTIVPRALTQIELAQSGGCQIIDGFICNSDGVKIKEKTSVCDENSDYKSPITYDQITNTVTTFMDRKKDDHADDFVVYLRNKYLNQGWTLQLFYMEKFFLFYVKASKDDNETAFYRYYKDRKDYISNNLGIAITVENSIKNSDLFGNVDILVTSNLIESFSSPIPKTYS